MTALTKLRVVACLFAVWGLFSFLSMFRTVNGRIQFSLTFGLLCIPIAIGLFALKPLWRSVALLVLWVSLALTLVFVAVALFQWRSIRVESFMGLSGTAAVVASAAFVAASTLLSGWSIRVLRALPVRELFGERVAQGS